MELINFRLNLNQSETTYEFEDVQVKLFDTLTATINGMIDVVFDSKDESGTEDEDRIIYFVDTVSISIQNIYDEDSEEISISPKLMIELKQEIENKVQSFDVENH